MSLPRRVALSPLAALVVVAALVTPPPRAARACAPAPMPGTYVSVTDEEALVVWDAARRVQHFVRRASFAGTSASFGFLVPTPTRPELAEAPDAIFGRLERRTRPHVEERTNLVPHTCCTMVLGAFLLGRSASDEATAAAPSVTVVDSARVAGLDATVLAATDAGALAAWLGGHGFERSAALEAWLAPYVAQGWMVTAFRYAKSSAEARDVSGKAVRMSFHTERPFFPYREPEASEEARSGAPGPRVLRVYYVGPARADGALGDRAAPWGARTGYARPLAADGAALLRGVVPDGAYAATSWLTQLVDVRAVRPTDTDLFFSDARDRSELDPVIYRDSDVPIPIPVELLVLGGAVWLLVRRRRKRRAQA